MCDHARTDSKACEVNNSSSNNILDAQDKHMLAQNLVLRFKYDHAVHWKLFVPSHGLLLIKNVYFLKKKCVRCIFSKPEWVNYT